MAQMRAAALRGAGYLGNIIPECEREGHADRARRIGYMATLDVVFTKTDRSMVLLNKGGYGGWWAVVDDAMLPGTWGTKSAALAAAREAERTRTPPPKTQHADPAPLPALPPFDINAATAWLRTPEMRHAARRAQLAHTEAALAHWYAEGRPA